MEKVLLTPKSVSEITGMDLDYCIYQTLGVTVSHGIKQDKNYYNNIEKNRKKLSAVIFELTDKIQIVDKNAVSDDMQGKCILHEAIRQNNEYVNYFIVKICQNKPSVDHIDFKGRFKHFENIFTKKKQSKNFRQTGRDVFIAKPQYFQCVTRW